MVKRNGTDYSLQRLSRDGFLSIPNKSTQSRVNQFFLDRQVTPVLKLWPVPDNNTDVIYYDALTRMDDADIYTNTMDMPFRFYPCLAAGLAYYIALKRAPNRIQMLKSVYEEEFDRAATEDRDRSSFNVVPKYDNYRVGVMSKFASGKNSWAISDRSGQRYKYRLMRREWNGLLVGPDEFEPKHPQLGPFRKVVDPEALQNARPDRIEPMDVYVGLPLIENPNLRPATGFGQVGIVTVVT